MKKSYLTPKTMIVMTIPQEVIATSILLNRGRDGQEEIWDESEMLSRRHSSVWDDDEEE